MSDFNGDGNADFAVGNVNSANFSVYLGNGAGGFTQAAGSPFSTGGSFTRFVVAEDFDRNGTVDIATANEASNNVSILTGSGTGGFTLSTTIDTGARPSGLVKGDFNNDGIIDLAVNTYSSTLLVLQGNGTGGFTVASTTSLPAFANFLESGKFNADNFLDLITDNDSGGNVPLFLNNGTGTFTGSTVNLRINNGSGIFTDGGSITGLDVATGQAIGDFDGDHRFDLVVAESNRVTSLLGCTFLITTQSLPNGQFNTPYSQSISVQGGTPSYTFSAAGLPNGLNINPSTGVISGAPSMAGTYSPVITATDSTAFAPGKNAAAAEAEENAVSAARQTSRTFQLVVQMATAANASIAGQALTADGRGIRSAVVSLTMPDGRVRTAMTSAFGYYRFDELPAGQTYVLGIAAKRFTFTAPTQIVSLTDNLTGQNFIASGN